MIVFGILGYRTQLALYGLETNEPFSVTGITIILLFIIKGITAFGLLNQKYWPVKAGIADAIIGITICALMMFYPIINSEATFSLRIELIALIPYLLKLLKIKTEWENFIDIQ